jgi:hypothetical protein
MSLSDPPRLSTKRALVEQMDGLGRPWSASGRGGEVRMAQYEAYCVKCKAKREFEGEVVTLKNGRKAAKGTCPVCGTTVMRILGKDAS